jgi:uncharacterized protein YcbK (DUF882 family)
MPSSHHEQVKRLCEWYLEPMREKFGACDVHSGFRTPEWNRINGGASQSYHLYLSRRSRDGVAADVSFAKGTIAQWHAEAKRLRTKNRKGQGGIGFYPQGGFIHIDTRDYKADWNGS